MQLSYFGASEKQLLGVYSPPATDAARSAAVLICPPAPQEYMRSHWSLRQLAVRLAAAGLHVMRFDYYGTGDSAGASDAGTLEQWREDIHAALEELSDVSGVRRPSLVGFRLGATLATQVAARLRELVLWEPVLSGSRYLALLRAAHENCFAHCLHPPPLPAHGPAGELVGHPLPPAVEAEIERLSVEAPLRCQAERVTIVVRAAASEERALAARLSEAGASATLIEQEEAEDLSATLLVGARGQESILKLLAEPRA